MAQYAIQKDLFGGETVAGDVVTKLTYVLEQNEEARGSYKAATCRPAIRSRPWAGITGGSRSISRAVSVPACCWTISGRGRRL
jgi:hypothetical protein